MQWLGWIYVCDHDGCDIKKLTSTQEPLAALVEAVYDGWLPYPVIPGRPQRIFCPKHAAAKASTR